MPDTSKGLLKSWFGYRRAQTPNEDVELGEMKAIGDRRCADALYALGRYGDLHVGELLCVFGGDPAQLAASIEKYQGLGYIKVEEQNVGDFSRFLSKVHQKFDLDDNATDKNWEVLLFISNEIDIGEGLRLRLTPMGNIAARLAAKAPALG